MTKFILYTMFYFHVGCERFSNYTGYGDTFRWAGNHIDPTPRDTWGRRCTEVVAIDALVVPNHTEQFQTYHVRRELNKVSCTNNN